MVSTLATLKYLLSVKRVNFDQLVYGSEFFKEWGNLIFAFDICVEIMAGVERLLMTKCNLRVMALDDVITSCFGHRFIFDL